MVAFSRLKATFEAYLGLFRQNVTHRTCTTTREGVAHDADTAPLAREAKRASFKDVRGNAQQYGPLPG